MSGCRCPKAYYETPHSASQICKGTYKLEYRWLNTDESRFSLYTSDRRIPVYRRDDQRYFQCNTRPSTNFGEDSTMFWGGISLMGHTELVILDGGSLTTDRDIFEQHVIPYAPLIGNFVIVSTLFLNWIVGCCLDVFMFISSSSWHICNSWLDSSWGGISNRFWISLVLDYLKLLSPSCVFLLIFSFFLFSFPSV